MAKRLVEGPGEIAARLRREGRYEAGVSRLTELQNEGVPLLEAWRRVGEEFRAVVVVGASVGVGSHADGLVRLEDFAGDSTDKIDAVQWVAEHLCVSDVGPSSAPGPLAWSMLQYARENPSNFWRDIWSKLLPSRSTLEQMERFKDDGRVLSVVDELLREGSLEH